MLHGPRNHRYGPSLPDARLASRGFLAGLCWMICMASVEAQQSGDPLPKFRVYSTADGLSQTEVRQVLQDGTGYLWTTSQRGISRFDGQEFVNYTIAQGLRRNHQVALATDPKNRIWTGDSEGGITMLADGQVVLTAEPPPGPISIVSGLLSTPAGLMMGTEGNGAWLLRVQQGSTEWVRIAGAPVNVDQLVQGSGGVLLRSGDRLWLFSEDEERFEPDTRRATQLGVDAAGSVWAVDVNGNVGVLGGSLPILTLDNAPSHFLPDPRGGFWWIDQELRLHSPNGNQFSLPRQRVLTMMLDREGTLWLGSANGLIRFLGERFEHFPLSETRDPRLIWTINQDDLGRHWFGADGGLVMRQPDGSLLTLKESQGLPPGPVRDVISDGRGGFWAGVRGRGVYRIDPISLQATLLPGTEGLELLDLELSENGLLWMATRHSGVFVADLESGQLSRSQLPPNGGVYTVAISGDNEIWAGVSSVGVMRLRRSRDGSIFHEPLPGGEPLASPFVGQISMLDTNVALVSTAEGGVFRYDNGQVTELGADTPLRDQNVYLVEPLPDGSFVVGGDEGLYHFDQNDQLLFRHHPLTGFAGTESNVHATFVDREGDLWIGTISGATRMDTSLPHRELPPIQPRIVGAHRARDMQPLAPGEPLEPADGGFVVAFTAVSPFETAGIEFSYRLAGVDEAFSEATLDRSVRYSSLPYGDHQFEVRERYPEGPWSAPAIRPITMLKPFWQQTRFAIVVAVALVLGVYAAVQWRLRRIAQVNQRLRQEVAERTQSIEEARRRLEETNRKLEYQANYDELTGLHNRRLFEARLTEVCKRNEQEADNTSAYLMFLDLDQFKVVNDTCGHTAGDALLRQVAKLLADRAGPGEFVGRLGGDEFGIILEGHTREECLAAAEQIREDVEELQFPWDKEVFRIGVSIGVVPIERERGDANELQQLADAACYAAKEAGRNQVHLVEGDTDQAQEHRGEMRWVQRLRDAMDNNRFALYGQLIRPLKNTDEPERMEILLRMRDDETRKLIPPGAFLPAAERYGLSIPLDEWVVTNLLKSLFVHHAFQAEGRRYWVNLSGASIGDRKFADTLLRLMADSPLPPGMVNFEITETAVIRSVGEAARLICALKEMGCEFALDDFGSGLSSFGYLKTLSVDYLKIDGMFVRDILEDETDRVLVKSIIEIARTLNIKTIAEFVENDGILEVVRDLGADYAQVLGSTVRKFWHPSSR